MAVCHGICRAISDVLKKLTMGQTLLMGRQTYESIGHPLPGRKTIILSRNPNYQVQGAEVVADLPAAVQAAAGSDELFICGGGQVYCQSLALVQRIYLTELMVECAGDVLFPELPEGAFRTLRSEPVKDRIDYRFAILERISAVQVKKDKANENNRTRHNRQLRC